jgi:putative FmdB family regulatory protein
MPFYEYKCPDCQNVIEICCSMADKPESVDCKCGSVAESMLSRFAFPFSAKAWRGRKSVCLQADDQHTQDQKQLSACVDDPNSKLPKKIKNDLLDRANKILGAF